MLCERAAGIAASAARGAPRLTRQMETALRRTVRGDTRTFRVSLQ